MPRETIASLVAQRTRLRQELEQAKSAGTNAVAAVEAYKADLAKRAHEYADANSLCPEFDAAMEALNLPARPRDHSVSITITVTASDEQAAAAKVAEMLLGVNPPDDAVQDAYRTSDPKTIGSSVFISGGWWAIDDAQEQ